MTGAGGLVPAPASGLAVTAAAAQQGDQPLRLTPAEFPLPLGIEKAIPVGMPPEGVFVSDAACVYFRKDGRFVLADCLG